MNETISRNKKKRKSLYLKHRFLLFINFSHLHSLEIEPAVTPLKTIMFVSCLTFAAIKIKNTRLTHLFVQVRAGLEKAKGTLEAENADLASELRTVTNTKQESDRRRKTAEQQLAELQSKIGEIDRVRSELAEKAAKLQQESDTITAQVRIKKLQC